MCHGRLGTANRTALGWNGACSVAAGKAGAVYRYLGILRTFGRSGSAVVVAEGAYDLGIVGPGSERVAGAVPGCGGTQDAADLGAGSSARSTRLW